MPASGTKEAGALLHLSLSLAAVSIFLGRRWSGQQETVPVRSLPGHSFLSGEPLPFAPACESPWEGPGRAWLRTPGHPRGQLVAAVTGNNFHRTGSLQRGGAALRGREGAATQAEWPRRAWGSSKPRTPFVCTKVHTFVCDESCVSSESETACVLRYQRNCLCCVG